MVKCYDCGGVAEDAKTSYEYYGEWSRREEVCPYCHGAVDDAYECPICHEWFLPNELSNGICYDCLCECMKDAKFVRSFISDNDLWDDWSEYVNKS